MDREESLDMSWGGDPTAGGASSGWSGDSWGGGAVSLPTNAPSPSSTSFGGGSSWGGGGGGDWGAGSITSAPSPSPAPPASNGGVSDDWGASSIGGGSLAAPPSSPAPAPAAPPQTPAPQANGWLGGNVDASNSSWGGGSAAPAAPQAPKSNGWLGGDDSPDGWGGGGGTGQGVPSNGMGSVADSGPTLGGGSETMGGMAPPAPASNGGGGWLGGGGPPADESQEGWLGGGGTATVESQPDSGWLSEGGDAPSMTEMVDRAIGEEESDDFVDDSWVDEEIRDGEYDDLEVPEYQPPAPEVGGAFVKMLLVAVLVLLVGGGMMFLRQDTKSPEEIAAEELRIAREDATNFLKTGATHLETGNAEAAVYAFKSAIEKLEELDANDQEILDATVSLATAQVKSGQFADGHKMWAQLAKESDEHKDLAKTMLLDANKGLRVQANDNLVKAMGYYQNGESNSVIKLGEQSLDIFKKHGGNKAQIGKAHGVIGRGYLNGYDYGRARTNLKKAAALNPKGDYKADFAKLAAAVSKPRPNNRRRKPAPTVRRVRKVDAKITTGPSYKTRTGPVVRRAPRRAAAAPVAAPVAAPARKTMKEIPAYSRASTKRPSTKGRKGQAGVLNGY